MYAEEEEEFMINGRFSTATWEDRTRDTTTTRVSGGDT